MSKALRDYQRSSYDMFLTNIIEKVLNAKESHFNFKVYAKSNRQLVKQSFIRCLKKRLIPFTVDGFIFQFMQKTVKITYVYKNPMDRIVYVFSH